MRPPRAIPLDGHLSSYNEEQALGKLLLWLINNHSIVQEEEVLLFTTFQSRAGETPLRLALLMTSKRVILVNLNELLQPRLLFSVC